MIFNEHVAPGELVVDVTFHVAIDMSVNHVSFSLEKLLKSCPQPPFEKELVQGQTRSLAKTSSAVPHSYKKFVRVVNVKSLNIRIFFQHTIFPANFWVRMWDSRGGTQD